MTIRKVVLGVMPLAVLVVLIMTSCGGGSHANLSGSLIPAAQAQTQLPPMAHWGNAVIMGNTVVLGQEFTGQPGNNPQTPVSFPIPTGATRVVAVQGNISLSSACQGAGSLVVLRFNGLGNSYAEILKSSKGGTVNLPVNITIPTPIENAVGWLSVGTDETGCPAGRTYFSNDNLAYGDTEVQIVIQFE